MFVEPVCKQQTLQVHTSKKGKVNNSQPFPWHIVLSSSWTSASSPTHRGTPACREGPLCPQSRPDSGRSCWRLLWTPGFGTGQTWRRHWRWRAEGASLWSFPWLSCSTSWLFVSGRKWTRHVGIHPPVRILFCNYWRAVNRFNLSEKIMFFNDFAHAWTSL